MIFFLGLLSAEHDFLKIMNSVRVLAFLRSSCGVCVHLASGHMVLTIGTKSMIMKWLVSLNYRDKPHWTLKQFNHSLETKKCMTFQSGLPFQRDPKNSDATRKRFLKKTFKIFFKKKFTLVTLVFHLVWECGVTPECKTLIILFVFSRGNK